MATDRAGVMVADISVFIVTYNSSLLLRSCLDSLMAQSVGDFETVVVDNASRDDTTTIIRQEYPSVHLIESNVNLGFGNANNLALGASQNGRYLVLLNPDAVLEKHALERAIDHMGQNPLVGMGGGLLQSLEGDRQPSARQFPSLLNEALVLTGLADRYPSSRFFGRFDRSWADPAQPAEVDWVPGAFAILRRDLIEKIGFFDPRFFLYYEEVDLCRRIRKAGFSVQYWPDVQINHVGGASSETVDNMAFSSSGKQLTLWRMRSQLLYYRKWHGLLYGWSVKALEQCWHTARVWRNARKAPNKAEESKHIIQLWRQAWQDTKAGRLSPPQPW